MKMKAVVAIFLVICSVAIATEPSRNFPEWKEPSFLEENQIGPQDPALNTGYVPSSVPFDNPAVSTSLTPSIPSSPDCTVRPQTVVEIKRMRRSAARISEMIQTEVVIMEKRKTYVEQMTAYINDRIRELNKVKADLEAENRWIEMSNQRIAELAEKEKLMKMQDILTCMSSAKERVEGQGKVQSGEIENLKKSTDSLAANIKTIQESIKKATE